MSGAEGAESASAQKKLRELEKRVKQLSEQFAEKEAECERLRQAHASYALAQYADKSTDLNELLDAYGDQILSIPNVEGLVVNLLNETGDALVTAYLRLPEEFDGIRNTYKGFHYPLDQPDVNVIVFQEAKPRIVTHDDLSEYAENTRMRFERWKMRNLLVLPLNVKTKDDALQPIGSVMVFSQEHFLDLQLAESVDTIGELFARRILLHWNRQQAIESAQTVKTLYAEIHQFISYMTSMNSRTTVEEVYAVVAEQFIKRFGFDIVGILLEENRRLSIEHIAFSKPFVSLSEKYEPFRLDTKYALNARDGASAMAYVNNQRFLFDDCLKLMHLPMSAKDKASLTLLKTPRTFLIVPIRLNTKPIGVMWLGTLAQTMPLPETNLALIELLISFISTAIRNAQAHGLVEQQHDQIESLSQDLQEKIALLDQVAGKDRVTGLNNFSSFEDELKRRTSEYQRAGEDGALSIILFDIDEFAQLSEAYGQQAVNQILQETGAKIRSCVRDMDFVARYGNEEFAVLLPQCDLANAIAIAERVRNKMNSEKFVIDGKRKTVTISGGCAQFHVDENSRDFISRVDEALYAAKRQGRNCIITAGDTISESTI
ncbi:MAG: GGDEF domain-containing protein [Burkholderiales bacterium]|nr:GGDEF domain-containing protein [Burkholderiales bacterium]